MAIVKAVDVHLSGHRGELDGKPFCELWAAFLNQFLVPSPPVDQDGFSALLERGC